MHVIMKSLSDPFGLPRIGTRSPLSMFRKKKPLQHVRIEVDFQPKISRWFVFRFLWIVPVIVPIVLFSIWFSILSFIHFFYMLVLGERSESIFKKQIEYIQYVLRWQFYFKYFTNERPDVLPWKL